MEFEGAYSLVIDKVVRWGNGFIKMLPNLLISILVVVAFWLVARVVRKLLKKGLSRVSESKSLVALGSTIAYVVIIVVGTFVALSVLHLDKAVTSMLAGVGVIGLALGFAFQDIAANFISGILIATRKPYGIGDLVETQGYMGHIQEMNLRACRIRTFQGQDVILPNRDLFQNPVTNYSFYPKRRIDLEVGVSYGEDLVHVRSIAIAAIETLSELDKNEEVTLFYHTFGDSSINFTIRYWISEAGQAPFLSARSEGVVSIKKAFDKENISIPYPIRTLDFGIKGGRSLEEVPVQIKKINE